MINGICDYANRDEIVLTTKVHGQMQPGPNGGGLSRKAIMSEIDKALSVWEPIMSICTRLAWLLQKQPVTAPIIGATSSSHLRDAAGALSIQLTSEEVASLEEHYVPHPVVGAL